jgi:predicted lipoprotein with Yx(FWY)xxD motif
MDQLLMRMPGAFAGLLFGAIACGGNYSAPAGNAPTMKLAASPRFGNHLVDGNGRSLYSFGADLPASAAKAAVSNCGTACVAAWPVFHADDVVVEGISADDVGEITRPDGSKQTTFRGWPLYFFAGDAMPGDLNGEGVGDISFVLRDQAYSILLMSSTPAREPEPYLNDGTGRSLYQFFQDTPGTAGSDPVSACTVGCLVKWPIFLSETAVVPSGLAASDFTVFTRPDGQRQSAYKGRPLYFFAGDAAPGDTTGRGVANRDTVDPRSIP